jgi:hypothetical protein
MTNYPIIEQRNLPKAQRGGLWGLGTRTRPDSDIPLPNAHEAVVYKSGGVYVVDDGRSRLDDDHIANATNISVVDMREEAPVTVHVSIPSGGAAEFKVQVTFLCTVRRPQEVVEAGLHDMEEPLTQYLAQHQSLFHVGEDYEFDQINTVRRDVTAEIKAYAQLRPPRFRGMEVTLGTVQVLTPQEHAEFERKRRERRREGVLTSEEQRQMHSLVQEREQLQQIRDVETKRFEHELKAQEELNNRQLAEMRRQLDEQLELQKHRHEQFMTEMRQEMEHRLAERQLTHDQEIQASTLGHNQRLQAASSDHAQRLRSVAIDRAIDEAGKLETAIGADKSEMPRVLAAAAGEHTFAEAADLLSQDRERKRESEAEEALRKQTWEREDSLRKDGWDREDAQYRRQAEREDAQMRFKLKLQELQAQVDILTAGISRGLADHQNLDKLMGAISSAVNELESASASGTGTAAAETTAPRDRSGETAAQAGDGHQPGSANAASAAPEADADVTVIDAQVVGDNGDPYDHGSGSADSTVREEDIGP